MRDNKWARLLAYITGSVNQRLLLQCESLIAENRVLRSHLTGSLRLSDTEPSTLAEIAKRLGRKHLAEMACVAKPDTILAWYRRLICLQVRRSKHRAYPGRLRIDPAIEALVVRMARENSSWGYDRILKRHGIAPAPKRRQNTTWKEFITAHLAVLAGTDYFTVEVLT